MRLDNDNKVEATYICVGCGVAYQAEPFSHRRFCDSCRELIKERAEKLNTNRIEQEAGR